MTRDEIGQALELLHGQGMKYTEVVEGFDCTVRMLEVIDNEVMEFRNKQDNRNNKLVRLPSKNWNMVEIDDNCDYHQSR